VRIPSATYRLQLNRSFTLAEAAEIIGYLHGLGVSDCYISPLTQARPGSPHGYDVVSHSLLNPEIGDQRGFRDFANKAQQAGIYIIVDTVPNHMCIADSANRWWFDVLENGPSSPYASYFDIDWSPPKSDLRNKVLIPVLGDQYGRVLENQEITAFYKDGAFAIGYYELVLPLAPRSWTWILEPVREILTRERGESDRDSMELASVITALSHLPLRTETDPAKVRERQREKEVIKTRLAALMEASPVVRSTIEATLTEVNGIRGQPQTFDRLEKLLADQAYRLSYWHVAADEINYRRFFDVNDLAAIRVEQPEVFRAAHELILRLIREGFISGLRIDHVDGLWDPKDYLHLLQAECAAALAGLDKTIAPKCEGTSAIERPMTQPSFYLVVEKILGADEALRADWPIHGTTGYEFLNDLNGLYVDSSNRARFIELYARFTGHHHRFDDIVYDCKKLVLRALMSGEQNVLARRLDRISEQHRWSRDFTLNSLGRALAEVIACLPVYRCYVSSAGAVNTEDRHRVLSAINAAKRRNAALSEATFDFLASVLLLDHPERLDDKAGEARLEFTLRFQQLTAPVMAKGLEDTALYRFFPLASLNEVGGNPDSFGISTQAFHSRIRRRLSEWPHGLSATSTHDTKRGEDVRARINVLSEMPEAWEQALHRWHALNNYARAELDGVNVPDFNEEYLFYQTLVGTWPQSPMTHSEHETFVGRIRDYMLKAAKEAKLYTSWISPNRHYEQALAEFVQRTLEARPGNDFLTDFTAFHPPIAMAGMLNSLSQTLIKACSPGVPDFYQGTELWDDNLVDPDNRRAVDFASRRAMLERMSHDAEGNILKLVGELVASPADGRIKMYIIRQALQFRRHNPELFAGGRYVALEPAGAHSRQVISFARHRGRQHVVVVAGRFFMSLGLTGRSFPEGRRWADTTVALPLELASARYVDVFTGRSIDSHRGGAARQLALSEVFAEMPVAMLVPKN
jgi:(1->4)-alpha-D-glucan 1-alpha-D-glucosylmutase